MPAQPSTYALIAAAFEYALAAIGVVLAWRLALSPAARARRAPPALARWEIGLSEFVLYFLHALFGWFVASVVVALIRKPLGLSTDQLMIFGTGMADLGLAAGVGVFALSYRGQLQLQIGAPVAIFRSGLVTFLVALPCVLIVSLIWRWLMESAGIPPEKQDVIALFERTDARGWAVAFAAIAVGLAPVAEELLFRAGLFRFFRTRLPRWAVLILPACLFAALHNLSLTTFAPLLTLGIVFALAYERTGSIGTPIVAHALFNLNNVLLVVLGINT